MQKLTALERQLQEGGAHVARLLNPGMDAVEVESSLDKIGLSSSLELSTWFAWHDGAGSTAPADTPSLHIELVPGAEFYDLAYLCAEYVQHREISRQLERSEGYPFAVDQHWRPSWLPLLRLFGKGYVVVDLAVPGSKSPLHLFWYDEGPVERALVVWPSLEAFVHDALDAFAQGTYFVDTAGVVAGPTLDR